MRVRPSDASDFVPTDLEKLYHYVIVRHGVEPSEISTALFPPEGRSLHQTLPLSVP